MKTLNCVLIMTAYIVVSLTILIIVFNVEVGPTKVITSVLAIILIAGGIFGGKKLSESDYE